MGCGNSTSVIQPVARSRTGMEPGHSPHSPHHLAAGSDKGGSGSNKQGTPGKPSGDGSSGSTSQRQPPSEKASSLKGWLLSPSLDGSFGHNPNTPGAGAQGQGSVPDILPHSNSNSLSFAVHNIDSNQYAIGERLMKEMMGAPTPPQAKTSPMIPDQLPGSIDDGINDEPRPWPTNVATITPEQRPTHATALPFPSYPITQASTKTPPAPSVATPTAIVAGANEGHRGSPAAAVAIVVGAATPTGPTPPQQPNLSQAPPVQSNPFSRTSGSPIATGPIASEQRAEASMVLPQPEQQLATVPAPAGDVAHEVDFTGITLQQLLELSSDPERKSGGETADEPINPVWWQERTFVSADNRVISIPELTRQALAELEAPSTSNVMPQQEGFHHSQSPVAVQFGRTLQLPPAGLMHSDSSVTLPDVQVRLDSIGSSPNTAAFAPSPFLPKHRLKMVTKWLSSIQ